MACDDTSPPTGRGSVHTYIHTRGIITADILLYTQHHVPTNSRVHLGAGIVAGVVFLTGTVQPFRFHSLPLTPGSISTGMAELLTASGAGG